MRYKSVVLYKLNGKRSTYHKRHRSETDALECLFALASIVPELEELQIGIWNGPEGTPAIFIAHRLRDNWNLGILPSNKA